MKNRLILVFTVCALTTGMVKAQMDNLSNMSARWVSSNTRNAATDAADIVNYNPSGTVRLPDGLNIDISNQTMIRRPKHTFNLGAGNKTYGQNGTDKFLPDLYLTYKKNNWAVSSGVYISGGGATANYPHGSINTTLMGYSYLGVATPAVYTGVSDQYLKASSYYLTVPLSFAYSLSNKLAISAGVRYIQGINKTEAGLTLTGSVYGAPDNAVTVNYKENAGGIGAVIGIFYQPSEKLALSAHYETSVKLDFETKDNTGTISLNTNGTKNRRDLPSVLCTGISYKLTEKIAAAADFNYYFQKNADWGTIKYNGSTYETSKVAGNCYTAGLGLSWDITSAFQLTGGCKYTAFLYDNKPLYYTKLGLYEVIKYNNLNFGLGGSYRLSKCCALNLGIGRTFWKDSDIQCLKANIPVSIEDKGYVIALGVDLTI